MGGMQPQARWYLTQPMVYNRGLCGCVALPNPIFSIFAHRLRQLITIGKSIKKYVILRASSTEESKRDDGE